MEPDNDGPKNEAAEHDSCTKTTHDTADHDDGKFPEDTTNNKVTQDVGTNELARLPASGSARGAAGGPPVGPGGGLLGKGAGSANTDRKRKPTEKGLEFLVNTKLNAFRTAATAWRNTAKSANKTMTEEPTILELKAARDSLERDLVAASNVYHDLMPLLNSNDQSDMQSKLEEMESQNLVLLGKLTDIIREIQSESGSRKSKTSKSSSRASSSSQARAQAAGEVAALKAKMKFVEREAEMVKALKRMQTEAELEMATAKYEALTNIEFNNHPYLNPAADVFVSTNGPPVTPKTPDNNVLPSQDPTQNGPSVTPMAPNNSYLSISNPKNTSHQGYTRPQEHDSFSKAIAEHMYMNRIPMPEPQQFKGDPLKYPSWRATFETLIGSRPIPPAERVHYLRRYLGGPAQEAVEGFLLLSTNDAYERAMNLLDSRYGNSFAIANAFRDKLDSWPKISARDGPGLRHLADFLYQCCAAMIENQSLEILNDERENKKILAKIPDWVIVRWGRKVQRYRREHQRFPPFADFAEFIAEEAEFANDPITALPTKGTQSETPADKGQRPKRVDKRQAGAFKVDSSVHEPQESKVCLYCKHHSHTIDKCNKFAKVGVAEKDKYVKENGLCFGCLGKGHLSKDCNGRHICTLCSKRHPTCLHRDHFKSSVNKDAQKDDIKQDEIKRANNSSTQTFVDTEQSTMTSMILPVFISHKHIPGREIRTYAMLDTQSDTTFISDYVYDALGIQGTPTQLLLSTLSSENELVPTNRVQGLVVRGIDSDKIIPLPATYTRSVMPVDRTHIPGPETARKWPHLQGIADKLSPVSDHPVGVLIGYNCPRALAPREVVTHDLFGPYAQKTDLGWGIVGVCDPVVHEDDPIGVCCVVLSPQTTPIDQRPTTSHIVMRAKVREVMGPSIRSIDALAKNVTKMMNFDFQDNEPGSAYSKLSQDDIRFLEIMSKNSYKTEDGHYGSPLPRKSLLKLPNNKGQALQRLSSLKRRLCRDQVLHEKYTREMNKVITRRYAEKVPEEEQSNNEGNIWYIPHHPVFNSKKPDKVRIVYDCSARFEGHSLNEHLLQGPDLANRLLGVLIRFRQEHIALTCDIEGMYHQFAVHEKDRNLLRFLWWENGDVHGPPTDYRMAVHLFGATSSPACATYLLRQIAADNEAECGSHAADFIKRNFYVDDGLKSMPDEQSAIKLAQQTTELCRMGGLRLCKFISNSKRVLEAIPEEDRALEVTSIDIGSDETPSERVLGMKWCVNTDTWGFDINIQKKPATRRGILSQVSQVYDPIGLVSPVVLHGKQILQILCKENADWDTPVTGALRAKWDTWREELPQLQGLSVARCYKPSHFGQLASVQLHHFSDASLQGYGVCSYLRLINKSSQVHCVLVMSKARVTPSMVVTIPRLELTAAVVAVKLSQFLQEELDYQDIDHFFWTDSKIVLGYISNEANRFHVFVSNRVQQIRSATKPSQWNHIGTKENPADLASRGCSPTELLDSKLWWNGPDFLWERNLPVSDVTYHVSEDDPEYKVVSCATSCTAHNSVLDTLRKYSSWVKLRKVVTICCNAQRIFTNKLKVNDLTPADIQAAEYVVIQLAQRETFHSEIQAIESNGDVGATSCLSKLNPFMDKGIVRVGGRIQHSDLPYEARHPTILPRNHFVSLLIIRHFHERVAAHQGRGITLNCLRSAGFWVIGASKMVARIIHSCVTCRRLRAHTSTQVMSNLPRDRVEPAPPFLNSAVDYFGPFYIKEGRKELKRWGVLFTCLASRAVHLDITPSLSTDAFVNAFRRFVSIRGTVQRLRSDRGTNFVGAKNELNEALKEMDSGKLKELLANNMCEFVFNSPHASHMGGVWERQIRTTRNVLSALMREATGQLDDDGLRTLMAEAANIINSRPLTVENLNDPTSLAPITPNQLLMLKTSVVVPPPGNFQRLDLYSRKRWRRVQHLANSFWSRWRKEFLMQMQQRQRWRRSKRDFRNGDIVLLNETDTPRCQWPIGRIKEICKDDDGHVRKVTILIGDPTLDSAGRRKGVLKMLERPIHKLVLLLEKSSDKSDYKTPHV